MDKLSRAKMNVYHKIFGGRGMDMIPHKNIMRWFLLKRGNICRRQSKRTF